MAGSSIDTGNQQSQISNRKSAPMSEPEISRRCSSCGAPVRQRALFCPQCGNGMTTKPAIPEKPSDSADDLSAKHSAIEHPEKRTGEQSRNNLDTAPLNRAGAKAFDRATMSDRDTVQLTPSVARAGSEDNVLGRVERLRKVSSVVIDQAAYDPSLRFLLVAGALFLLFLLLLILSKVMG